MSTTEVPLPASSEPAQLYRYSTWVHIGAGAEQCQEVDENEGTNGCGDRGHFHAWCRLPNPLQQAQLRERAMAAKARKIRQLRDPESDGHAILEEEFDGLARQGENARAAIIEELLSMDYWQDYYQAMMEVRQLEDEDQTVEEGEERPKLYAQISDDQARYLRLERLPESDRPKDEFEELQKHLTAYQDAINEALRARSEPKREALDGLDLDGLLAQLRDKRIDAEAQLEFQRVFDMNEWLSCTYREPHGAHALADLEVLEGAAPEVILGLQSAFADLKRTAQEAQGN